METARLVKMSACKNLSSVFGEPDHEQNKADLAFWNNHFDSLFAKKWGVDPKSGEISQNSEFKWEKVDENSDDVSGAYMMSSLTWSCAPRADRKRKCPGGDLFHLGLSGSRSRNSSPVSVNPKPLGEMNPNTTPSASPVQELDSCLLDNLTDQTDRPVTPDSTKQQDTASSASVDTSESSSSTVPSSSSRKRKQTTISDFYPQKKKACINRKILQS